MIPFERVTLASLLDTGRALISGPFGSNISSRFFVEYGIPVIRGNNLTSGMERFVDDGFVYVTEDKANELRADAATDDLIFTAAGTIGQVGLIPRNSRFKRYVISNKQIRARLDRSKVDPLFAFYWFSAPSSVANIQAHNTGSTIPLINLSVVRGLEIDLPKLSVQRQIVELLGTLDDKVELNRRMNETLEAMAQAIFRDWFVDFGPTRRKLEGATDPLTIMGGLMEDTERAQALADLFPAALGDDGLPDGWTFKPLDKSLVLQRGFDLPKSSRTDGSYPVIAASGPSGTHSEFKVSAPGVCTGRSGVLGNVFYVQQDFWPLNTSLWIKEYPNATPIYAYFLLKEIDLLALNAGSAVPTLNRNHVHNRPTVTPPMAVVSAYSGIAEMLMVKADQAAKECQTLAAIRDLLLPKLMSGEIRLYEAEDLMEAAQ